MNDLVSIIIPAYNSENTISRTLFSLINQTYTNTEILIVNDGSTDSTQKLCEHFAELCSNIKCYYKKNGGVSSARNFGIEHARGNYILFVDADDWVDNNYVELLVTMMLSDNYDMCMTGWIKENEKGNCLESCKKIMGDFTRNKAIFQTLLFDGVQGYSVNKLFRADIIDTYKIRFDESIYIYEDLLFVVEYLSHCNVANIYTINTYHYVINNFSAHYKSIESKKFNIKWLTEINALNKIEKIVSSKENKEMVKARIALSSVHYLKRMFECYYTDDNTRKMLITLIRENYIYPYKYKIGNTAWKMELFLATISPTLLKIVMSMRNKIKSIILDFILAIIIL